MQPLPTELTWQEIQELFAKDRNYNFRLTQHRRRSKAGIRKRGEVDERKVWRLNIQRDHGCFVKSILSRNIRSNDDKLLETIADGKIIRAINNSLMVYSPYESEKR